MNIGREIVAEALRSLDLKPYVDAGLTDAWLNGDPSSRAIFDGEDKLAYQWLLNHYRKHKRKVEPELFVKAYTTANYPLPKSKLTPAELIEAAQNEATEYLLNILTDDLVELHDDRRWSDVVPTLQGAISRLQKGIKETAHTAPAAGDFDVEESMSEELEMGARLGINLIDNEFFGFQPSHLITILGRQKSTKSYLMVYSALQAWEDGFDVLFYSVELDIKLIRQRLYSFGAKVDPERYRRGDLKETEKSRVRGFHKRMESEPVQFRISQKSALVTIDEVAAEVDHYRPHVVYIDGFYFMQDRHTGKSAGSDWQANENVAAELKALAMDKGIAIVTSTQSQEKQQGSKKQVGIEARTIMGGTGLLKASDLVLGLSRDGKGVLINEVFSRFLNVPTVSFDWDWDALQPVNIQEYTDPEKERSDQRDAFVREMGNG